MKNVVQDLYNLIVQAYDHKGTPTETAMREQMFVDTVAEAAVRIY